MHILLPSICYDVKFIEMSSTDTGAQERGQDLKDGSRKYLSQLQLAQSVNICLCSNFLDTDLCCCLVHKNVWLGKAIKIFWRKVTTLQVIINPYFGKQNEQICLHD